MKTLLLTAAAATVAGVATLAGPAAPQKAVEIGDRVEYSFRTPPANSLGVKKLSDLRGKPVLVEFWGTR